jgi:deoxyribose-phosphate aldolase
MIAMDAGADFIKTSTGKTSVSATPEAAFTMCRAIMDFYTETGIKVGFKAAGGIVTTADALTYYNIVSSCLGEEWLNNNLFRIGASRLANNILADISGTRNDYF